MKIGLVRHFKVKRGYPGKPFLTPGEVNQWIKEYDSSDVEVGEINLGGIAWNSCFSSNLPRAVFTADSIFTGSVTKLEELREISPIPNLKSNLKLPFILYPILVRIGWYINHRSQHETKKDILNRVNRAIDRILESDGNVLIVGHGGVMRYMRKELVNRGFDGPVFNIPEHGRVYIFEDQN